MPKEQLTKEVDWQRNYKAFEELSNKKTRGIYGIEKIKGAIKNSIYKQKGFTFDCLDFSNKRPFIQYFFTRSQ